MADFFLELPTFQFSEAVGKERMPAILILYLRLNRTQCFVYYATKLTKPDHASTTIKNPVKIITTADLNTVTTTAAARTTKA